jgi:hypothetical protein
MASSRKVGIFPNEKTAEERLIITDPVVEEAEGEEVRVGLSFSFSTSVFEKTLTVEFFG